MPKDLTAILLRRGALTDEDIRRAVLARGYGDVLVRIAPLDAVGLVQVEVHHTRDGLPCEDPALVELLASGGLAAFVHVNHSAAQAVLHAFHPGGAQPGFAGAPGDDFDSRLRSATGATLEAITAADDGTRIGIGIASSRTVALKNGRALAVPAGSPTDLQTFAFHDRGLDLDEDGERLALFAFDGGALGRALETPGRELAARLSMAGAAAFGPLEGARAEVVARLAELGDRPLAQLRDVRAVELCALDVALAFAGGDAVGFWDDRVLPLLSLVAGEPVVGAGDLEDLEASRSVLEALVEILPSQAPPGGEGSMLASIGDGELGPLAPWARPGEEYAGTIFTLSPARLLDGARRFGGPELGKLMEKLERAWYRAARPGQPEGDALAGFRRGLADEGKEDVDRVLRDWAELRLVLELAAANQLQVALFFYEGK